MVYIAYICEKCHGKDKNVIKCETPFHTHSSLITSLCDICGKMTRVCFCAYYPTMGREGVISISK